MLLRSCIQHLFFQVSVLFEEKECLMSNKPFYRVFVVENRNGEEDEDFWTQVGVAFAHKDQKGMNIVLRALPLDGRLVLRRYIEKQPNTIE